jgi:hypothetical protein
VISNKKWLSSLLIILLSWIFSDEELDVILSLDVSIFCKVISSSIIISELLLFKVLGCILASFCIIFNIVFLNSSNFLSISVDIILFCVILSVLNLQIFWCFHLECLFAYILLQYLHFGIHGTHFMSHGIHCGIHLSFFGIHFLYLILWNFLLWLHRLDWLWINFNTNITFKNFIYFIIFTH